jgi:hypothetical protein
MNRKTIGLGICLLFITGSIFASSALRGSDYVRLGVSGSVTGTLKESDGEWFLTTKEAREYAVHLGNYEVLYPEGIALYTGSQASVKGFMYENEISAVSVSSDGNTWKFRNADGRPLWSGEGNRQNANSDTHSEWI